MGKKNKKKHDGVFELVRSIKDEEEKKKNKPKVDSRYSMEMMQRDADNFEAYLDIIDRFAIITSLSKEEYKKSMKKARKMVRLLREGRGEEVYNENFFEEDLG